MQICEYYGAIIQLPKLNHIVLTIPSPLIFLECTRKIGQTQGFTVCLNDWKQLL